jgi:hypothetical protein
VENRYLASFAACSDVSFVRKVVFFSFVLAVSLIHQSPFVHVFAAASLAFMRVGNPNDWNFEFLLFFLRFVGVFSGLGLAPAADPLGCILINSQFFVVFLSDGAHEFLASKRDGLLVLAKIKFGALDDNLKPFLHIVELIVVELVHLFFELFDILIFFEYFLLQSQ